MAENQRRRPEGIFSLLDTDLYKLTMQSAVLKYFPDVEVTYAFSNRTPDMRLNRAAYSWLQQQIERLGNITVSQEEIEYLRKTCSYLSDPYLHYLSNFRLQPEHHIRCEFTPVHDTGSESDIGDLEIHTGGLWVETILYEIPLLALTSEAYFKFIDRDWSYDSQRENARLKGLRLLENACLVSEFGSRRRRDYHTHELVLQGLSDAQAEGQSKGYKGKITGTSNVHLAMRFGIPPIGTVAHEWFMGVAAVTDSYPNATETALRYWVATFGKGVLGIALTDTFGTPAFLDSFRQPVPSYTAPGAGGATTSQSSQAASTAGDMMTDTISSTDPPVKASGPAANGMHAQRETYADVFTGTRQDSGNPLEFIKIMREFYDREGITGKKVIVFSDSLDVDRCIEYREAAEKEGFQPSFGVGTFLTSKSRSLSVIQKYQLTSIRRLSPQVRCPKVDATKHCH